MGPNHVNTLTESEKDQLRENPYWNEAEGRIKIPKLTADNYIIYNQNDIEWYRAAEKMGLPFDQDLFYEDMLLYQREHDKNIALAKNLDPIFGYRNTLAALDAPSIAWAKAGLNRRQIARKMRPKYKPIMVRTSHLAGSGAAAGFATGGVYGAAVGGALGVAAGGLIGLGELFWTGAQHLTGYRPKNVGLDYKPGSNSLAEDEPVSDVIVPRKRKRVMDAD